DAPFSIASAASADSGQPISFSVFSGPATVTSAGVVTLTGAGEVVINATQPGDPQYMAAMASQTFSVAPRALTVTANDADKAAGLPNPAFTNTLCHSASCGLVAPDTFTFSYATTATDASPAGTYPITVSATGANAAAYTITYVAGTLTVHAPSPTTLTLTSTPGGTGGSGTISATLLRSSGVPLANESISFGFNGGNSIGSALTNNAGIATITVSLAGVPKGSYPTFAHFGGDVSNPRDPQGPSNGNGTLNVLSQGTLTIADLQAIAGRTQLLTASIQADGVVLPGLVVTFALNGTALGSATTASDGVARLNVTIPNITAGSYPGGFTATEPTHGLSASANVTVRQDQLLTFAPIQDQPLDTPSFNVSPSSSAGLPVTVISDTPGVCTAAPNASGGFTITGLVIGQCTLRATQAGNGTFPAAVDVSRTFFFVSNRVVAWGGGNGNGQLNVPANALNVRKISATGPLSLALTTNGTVLQWGTTDFSVPADLQNPTGGQPYAIDLSAGIASTGGTLAHVLAVMSDHTLRTWGRSWFGMDYVAPGLSNVKAVAAGGQDLALLNDGSVFAWQGGYYAYTDAFTLWGGGAKAIATGLGFYNYALIDANDNAVFWSLDTNTFEPIGPNSVAGPFTAIAVEQAWADYNSYLWALGADGRLSRIDMATGAVTHPLAGTFTGITAGQNGAAAITSDGHVVVYGGYSDSPVGQITALAAGGDQVLAITNAPRTTPFLSFEAVDASGNVVDSANVRTPKNVAVSARVSLRDSAQTATNAGLAGRTITLKVNGAAFGTATTDATGIATFAPLAVSGFPEGTSPNVFSAAFAGDNQYGPRAITGDLVVLTPAAPQTVTIAAITGKTYGDVPFTPVVTATSGLPVSLSVTSGPATAANNVLTLTGAGTVTLLATQTGSVDFLSATATASFTVAPAPLTIRANDVSHAINAAPLSSLTGTITGALNGDTFVVT
ncbi:MAG: hypothetical protein JST92_11630, partial [Deltaproteobacteria bacterium]|nr:hypothetical protein [Deltaproteobacteria bacterium]